MTEFEAYRGDAIQIKENIIAKITALSSFSSDDPKPLLAEVESLFRDLSSQIDLIKAQQTMWDTAEREAATRFVQELSAESRRLGDRFADERQRIEKRPDATSNMDTLIQGTADEDAVAGAGIMRELESQRDREVTGGGHVEEIEIDGNTVSKTGLPKCNDSKKTIAIWVVVGIALLGLLCLLYFTIR
jgi:hypothetical protein